MARRVLHVVCDAADGGAERLVIELVRRAPDDLPADIATIHDGGPLSDALGGVFSAGRRRGTPGVRALVRLARFLRGYDLVHTHQWPGDTWGRPAAALARVPVRVSTVHNVDRDEPAWKRRVNGATARLVQRVFVVSSAVGRHVAGYGVPDGKIEVIANGIDRERFAASWDGLRSSRVLFVGRLVPQKGVDVLAAAAVLVPEALVEVVGAGALRPAGLAYVGPADDVPARLARARVAVVPSRWEGFSLFAAEAMAAGTPVVASDVDGLAEVVGDAGLLVPAGDSGALADALRRVLTDDALAMRLSAAGRARAARFSIEGTVSAYAAAYRRLLP